MTTTHWYVSLTYIPLRLVSNATNFIQEWIPTLHIRKRCRRCTNQFSLDYLQGIRKTQLVQNRPVPSQQLENTHVKKKRRKLEATSTITSNELSNTVTHIVTECLEEVPSTSKSVKPFLLK